MTAPVIQFKRGLLANLPGLRVGEPGFTTDSYDLYVGLTSETSTNKFLGSHRYWTKETTSTGSGVNLVEGTSNGSNYITLQSPDSLAGIVTYYLPGSQGSSSSVLTNDGNGNLTWASGSDSPTFTGIATFTDTTDNTLGNANTGAVQIDGGIGINKNATIGANLNVQGYSQFVGVSTFTGAIDANGGADISGGETTLSSATVSDLTSGRLVLAGASGSLEDSGNLTFDGSTLRVTGEIVVNSGVSTFTGNLDINASTDISGNLLVGENANITGVTTFVGTIDAKAGAAFTGGETVISSASISDLTSGRVVITGASGSLEDSGNLTFDGSKLNLVGLADLDEVNVSSAATIVTADITYATIDFLTFTSGTAISSVDTDLSTVSGSHDTLASAKSIKDYVDALVTAQDLDFAGDVGTGAVDLDNQTFTIAGTANEIETSATNQTITIGLPDNVIVGAALTVTGALDVNGGGTIDNIQIGVTGDNEIDTSTGNLTIDSAGGTTTIDDELVVSGDVRINGNDIKASDGNTNITLTSNTLTTFAGDIKVTGNDIQSSSATAITLSGANVTVAGDLTVGGSDIKASDGTTALTLADSTGAVTTANDLTVSGNLYVSGNTTQVNTAALTVEDRTIDLGIVNGSAPSSATTWDLGVLFNYHSGGSAKKSAVIWEHGDTRFKFASVLASDTNGSDSDTPQLSVTTFAPIEIGALWVNDCAGSSQVISCTGTERFLENITIDAGTF